jgi:hypothetical protein
MEMVRIANGAGQAVGTGAETRRTVAALTRDVVGRSEKEELHLLSR